MKISDRLPFEALTHDPEKREMVASSHTKPSFASIGNRDWLLVALLTIVALCVVNIPLTVELRYAHDLSFHLGRIESIAEGLKDGIIPVKIYSIPVYGFGYASGVMYGDLFLYLPACLYALGLPLKASYLFFVFVVNCATYFTAFFCFRKIFGSDTTGTIGALLWTRSLHRLTLNDRDPYDSSEDVKAECLVGGGEYLPQNVSEENLKGNLPRAVNADSEEIVIETSIVDGLCVESELSNLSSITKTATFPLICYKGYQAVGTNESGEQVYLTISANPNSSLIDVAIPPGKWKITLAFHEPWYWRASETVSLLTLVIIVSFAFRKKLLGGRSREKVARQARRGSFEGRPDPSFSKKSPQLRKRDLSSTSS